MKKDQLGQDALEQYKQLRDMVPKSMAAGNQFLTTATTTAHMPASYYTASTVAHG